MDGHLICEDFPPTTFVLLFTHNRHTYAMELESGTGDSTGALQGDIAILRQEC